MKHIEARWDEENQRGYYSHLIHHGEIVPKQQQKIMNYWTDEQMKEFASDVVNKVITTFHKAGILTSSPDDETPMYIKQMVGKGLIGFKLTNPPQTDEVD